MQPWYQLVPIQYAPTNKLPYQKLQYAAYVKDIDFNVHIKIFKKVIKANSETLEVDIVNLVSFIL